MRYAIRAGESLAIASDAIRRDADGLFFLMPGEAPKNETRGTVTIVNIRGALQQFDSPEGDSYESICCRVAEAFTCEPLPSAVVLRISSPGGVVAGLNETVYKLRRMSKQADIPLVAYVDELAASAAYALCCACSEVLIPPSGVCGSIGVISTMVSVVKADESEGIEYRIITSGSRKADGHLHAPISDAAVKSETARNAKLATQFFRLASEARGISPKRLEGLQAAIYLGKDAERVGLVDDVMSLDAMLEGLDRSETNAVDKPAPNHGNETDRRAKEEACQVVPECASETVHPFRSPMSIKLDAIIKRVEAELASEKDDKKLSALKVKLAALAVTKAEMDDDKEPKKGDEDDDDDDESKAQKAAKKAEEAKRKAEAAKHRARAAEFKKRAEESEEEAKKAEEDDDEEESAASSAAGDEAQAALDLVQSLTGMQGAEALGAIRALAATAVKTAKDVAAIKAENLVKEKARLIDSVSKASTSKEREFLDGQTLETVRGFVKMRLSSGFVNTSEDELVKPKHVAPDSEASLPKESITMIEQAVTAYSGDAKAKAEFRAALVKNHLAVNQSTNGMRY